MEAASVSAGRRIVAYIDIDRPSARASYGRFLVAMQNRRLQQRFGIEAVFVPVDQSKPEELAAIPKLLEVLAPSVVVATSSLTALAVRDLQVPAVFYTPGNPVLVGLARTMQRPGGTMTGYASRVPSIGKMLEVLADGLPKKRRVALLTDREFLGEQEADVRNAALSGRADEYIIESREDFDRFMTRDSRRYEALAIPYTRVPFLHGEHVVSTLKHGRVPALLGSSRLLRLGGLFCLEPDYYDADDVLVRQIESIVRGVPPGEIPVERSRIFRLALNLQTARAIGVEFPVAFIKRADVVLS